MKPSELMSWGATSSFGKPVRLAIQTSSPSLSVTCYDTYRDSNGDVTNKSGKQIYGRIEDSTTIFGLIHFSLNCIGQSEVGQQIGTLLLAGVAAQGRECTLMENIGT